jgi:hypothetical protein
MKTLSRTFCFVVLAVIVIAVVASCCNLPFIPNILSYSVEIGTKQQGAIYAPKYVEWKSEKKFNDALAQIRSHNDKRAGYCFCVIKNSGDHPRKYKFNDKCTDYECPPGDIRTVKVTKAKAADKIAAGESAANDPHVTYRIQSPYPGDITAVLGALEQ